MPRRYISEDSKQQIVILAARLGNPNLVGELMGVHPSTVRKVVRLADSTGSVVRKPLQRGRHRALNGLHLAFLEGCIERTPDISLAELRDELAAGCNMVVSESTISRSLHRRGFSYKKVTREALERNDEHRDQYLINIGENYRVDQLVFVDESGFNRNTTRRRNAWAPVGDRARRRDYFIRGQRYSILPAISLDGVLHLDIQERAYNAELFDEFIGGLLDKMNPFPQHNSVVVMDNASIHKSPTLRLMIEARGMRLAYLPAYSPDLNPIEEAFSAMKAWIRTNRDFVRGELTGELACDPYRLLWEAVFISMTPTSIAGWFAHSGYL